VFQSNLSKHFSIQAPSAVVMVRPHCFSPNPQTASDNHFQQMHSHCSALELSQKAFEEHSLAQQQLEHVGVKVHLFEDQQDLTPDSVFPNNWFSTHTGGHIALYPMFSPNRRLERRSDIIESLKQQYRVQDVIDYTGMEYDDLFLEGTGAMVLDHLARIAYVAQSKRADPVVVERFCTHFNYEPMVFNTADQAGMPIYHTNVMMCIATEFALLGTELITSQERAKQVVQRLAESGKEWIDLSAEQITHFAGNALELNTQNGRVLAISARALGSLKPEQIKTIEKSCQILSLNIPTIEMAGGSVRCMLAGIHLSRR
jgi:hypothetical protein